MTLTYSFVSSTSSRHHLFFSFFLHTNILLFSFQADMLYKIVKYVQLFFFSTLVYSFFPCIYFDTNTPSTVSFYLFTSLSIFVTHDYLYTNTSFFFRFFRFTFFRFRFSFFRFRFTFFPFPLMLMLMLMLIHIKKRNINGNVNVNVNVIFIVIFSLYTYTSFFFRLSFFHIQKNETNSCQFQFIRVINTPSIT